MGNNNFGLSYTEWRQDEQLRKNNPEIYEKKRKEKQELINHLGGIVTDLTPILGDIKGFYDADGSLDYVLAVVSVFPGADAVVKSLKIAKKSQSTGDIIDEINHLNDAYQKLERLRPLDVDSYKNLKIKEVVGDGLEHDHIPSFAALKMAKEKEIGRPLTPLEIRNLRNNAIAIEVPKEVHRESRTYKGNNSTSRVEKDANSLCTAPKCDIEKLRANLLNYGYDRKRVEEAILKIIDRNKEIGIR